MVWLLAVKVIAIIILAPLAGGLLAGFDRIISARLQGRKGPPLFQPFYDVLKLMQKESLRVNSMHSMYVFLAFIFNILAVVILIAGGDILLAIFSLTVGSVMFILGGYASGSPYSTTGAQRELLQVTAYEPMLFLTAVGLYYINNSFFVKDIAAAQTPAVIFLPGIFIGLVYILTFKLRKSPFDLSTSHHGHQEIVKGITTEFSGKELALVEVMHWYETIMAFALVYLFFVNKAPISHLYALGVCVVLYIFEVFIDNGFARVKWQLAIKATWIITLAAGTINLVVLSIIR